MEKPNQNHFEWVGLLMYFVSFAALGFYCGGTLEKGSNLIHHFNHAKAALGGVGALIASLIFLGIAISGEEDDDREFQQTGGWYPRH